MENNKLIDIWKEAENEIKFKSTQELNTLLEKKIKNKMGKFLLILSIDIAVCSGLISFLFITAMTRQNDTIYLINNIILAFFTLFSLITSIVSIKKLKSNKNKMPLKTWLKNRIDILSNWLTGKYSKIYIVVIPILLIMITSSIHIYFENKPSVEVLSNEESIFGLIFGICAGMIASFYAVGKIRRYQMNNLIHLKELYKELD